MPGPILTTKDLSKTYDNLQAVKNVSFSVERSEIFSLLGPNGAGKTTTISMLSCLIAPSGGDAWIGGHSILNDSMAVKRMIGVIPQELALYKPLIARQNLDFFARLGGRATLTKADYYRALGRVSLQEKAFDQRVKNFSKRMRQKLGIAIAIVKGAPAVLLDEPTSGLDPKAAAEFLEIMTELRTEGKAVLMSTHDIFRAKEIGE